MSDVSPILSLPLIQPAQAQKHVTHNEALRLLDLIVQGVVLTRGGNTPPATPTAGDRHIVGTAPTGAWAGQANRIAFFEAGVWQFLTALPGWSMHVLAEDAEATLIDGTWQTLAERDLEVGAVGINAPADPVNRLNVSAAATLLSHDGAGHQLKINKATAADTASLLFQTGFSGRAEMGTAGTDDFAINVSATGSGFVPALQAAAATGHVSLPQGVLASGFTLRDPADPTKRLSFSLSGLAGGAAVTLSPPATSGEIAGLAGTQTFTGAKTFSGTLTASGATATIGTATGSATYGLGTGATAGAATKTVNLGTEGLSGSTTVVNIGSAVAGAGGQTIVNTPTVTFAASVTAIGAAQANLSVARAGIGGATADATNRLSVNAPATLLNHAGGSHEATVNKAAAANDAAIAFKTGFSTRALFGLLGNDDLALKVSADGATYSDALVVNRTTGRAEFPAPVTLPGVAVAPAAPAAGRLALYARSRAGSQWPEVARPAGRDFPLQPHLGFNRVATWSPNTSNTIIAENLPPATVGTISHPALAAGSLLASSRRWRVTSAATIDSAADHRCIVHSCFRGDAAGLGGFTLSMRFSLATLQPTGMGFFGLQNVGGALPATTLLSALVSVIGIGFQRGTHANWQLVVNDGTGAPTLTDLGASFPVATGGLLSLLVWAPPNGTSVWMRVTDEVSGAVFEQDMTANIPTPATFLAVRMFLSNAGTAAAVAWDCTGVYLETDY